MMYFVQQHGQRLFFRLHIILYSPYSKDREMNPVTVNEKLDLGALPAAALVPLTKAGEDGAQHSSITETFLIRVLLN